MLKKLYYSDLRCSVGYVDIWSNINRYSVLLNGLTLHNFVTGFRWAYYKGGL